MESVVLAGTELQGLLGGDGDDIAASMWNEPDQFDWITAFWSRRGLLGSAQRILATVAVTAGTVPLSMLLLGQQQPSVMLVIAESIGMVLTLGMAVYW